MHVHHLAGVLRLTDGVRRCQSCLAICAFVRFGRRVGFKACDLDLAWNSPSKTSDLCPLTQHLIPTIRSLWCLPVGAHAALYASPCAGTAPDAPPPLPSPSNVFPMHHMALRPLCAPTTPTPCTAMCIPSLLCPRSPRAPFNNSALLGVGGVNPPPPPLGPTNPQPPALKYWAEVSSGPLADQYFLWHLRC